MDNEVIPILQFEPEVLVKTDDKSNESDRQSNSPYISSGPNNSEPVDTRMSE